MSKAQSGEIEGKGGNVSSAQAGKRQGCISVLMELRPIKKKKREKGIVVLKSVAYDSLRDRYIRKPRFFVRIPANISIKLE
jgi:hypothetical protein